jgi:hypothetical protein
MSEVAAVSGSAGEAKSAPPVVNLADGTREQQIEERYLKAIGALVEDAGEHDSTAILVEVLTWTLARIAVGYGTTGVSGDILLRLGRHMCDLTERKQAQDEAVKSRKAGHAAH